MFEKAARLKIRFDSPQGSLSVEELWDAPLTSKLNRANLDDIAKMLDKQIKDQGVVSFVNTDATTNPVLDLKFEIVKHIIAVKMAENKAAALKKDNAAKKQKLLELIATKQDEAMGALGVEELQKMVEELNKAD